MRTKTTATIVTGSLLSAIVVLAGAGYSFAQDMVIINVDRSVRWAEFFPGQQVAVQGSCALPVAGTGLQWLQPITYGASPAIHSIRLLQPACGTHWSLMFPIKEYPLMAEIPNDRWWYDIPDDDDDDDEEEVEIDFEYLADLEYERDGDR